MILGASGRDFHNFNAACRDDQSSLVVAFTAAQIPALLTVSILRRSCWNPNCRGGTAGRAMPLDEAVFAYSDVPQAPRISRAGGGRVVEVTIAIARSSVLGCRSATKVVRAAARATALGAVVCRVL